MMYPLTFIFVAGTTNNFFFLMKLYTDSLGEPVVGLIAIKDKVFIKDVLNKGLCPKSGCPSVALGDYTDSYATLHDGHVRRAREDGV